MGLKIKNSKFRVLTLLTLLYLKNGKSHTKSFEIQLFHDTAFVLSGSNNVQLLGTFKNIKSWESSKKFPQIGITIFTIPDLTHDQIIFLMMYIQVIM